MKKALKSFVVLIVALTLAICGSLAAFADEYGTREDGIMSGPGQSHQHKTTPTNGFKNGDFSEGLRYWTTVPPNTKPSQFVALKSEGGKNYVSLTPSSGGEWDGIVCGRFKEDRLSSGDRPIVVYEWRSETPEQFQIWLGQGMLDEEGKSHNGTDSEFRLSNGASQAVSIIKADSDKEWNVSMSLSVKEVQKPNRGDDGIYLFVGVQAFQSKGVKADIANLRLATYNSGEGRIYDLDGKVMYDLKEISSKEIEGFYTYTDPFTLPAVNKTFAEGGEVIVEKEDENTLEPWVWIVIIVAAAVIILSATAVVVVIIVVKKKKSSAAIDESNEGTEKEAENNE